MNERELKELEIYKMFESINGEKRHKAIEILNIDYNPSDKELDEIYKKIKAL